MNTLNAWSDSNKYDELVKVRLSIQSDTLLSDFTTYTITPDTKDCDILKIPKNDCKYLLSFYARNAGYPDCIPKIKQIKVQKLRSNLKDARDTLKKCPHTPPRKKFRSNSTIFVLTHETSDHDINNTEPHVLHKELKSIYQENNLYESVVWDELSDEGIIEMIKEERDKMRGCIEKDDNKFDTGMNETDITSQNSQDFHEITSLSNKTKELEFRNAEDDMDINKMETKDEDNTQTVGKHLVPVPQPFNMNVNTSDNDIYGLNHARAQGIAIEYVIRENNEARQQFVEEATTEELYDYLIIIRNHIRREKEFADFGFSADTKDEDIKN